MLYSNAGERDKAIHYYKQHLEQDRSATVWFNLACEYQYKDAEEYVRCLEQSLSINPEHGLARYRLLKHQIATRPSEDLRKQLNDLFNEWQSDYESGNYQFHISWLISCAQDTKNYEFARQLKEGNDSQISDSLYNTNNLVITKG